jgi:hypothetical protein
MSTMSPPAGKAPFKQITLHSGTTYFPDFSKGGHVNISDEADAQELVAEGWTRDAASAKAAKFDADLLRKGMASQLRRGPGVGEPVAGFDATRANNDGQSVQFSIGLNDEKIPVKYGDRVIVVAGIELPTDELPTEVRRELETAMARLDGASFDVDANLLGVQEARRAIEWAIFAVMSSKPYRDRLITAGTRRVAEQSMTDAQRRY